MGMLAACMSMNVAGYLWEWENNAPIVCAQWLDIHIYNLPHPWTSAKPVSVSTWQEVIWESVEDIYCVRLLQSEKNGAWLNE